MLKTKIFRSDLEALRINFLLVALEVFAAKEPEELGALSNQLCWILLCEKDRHLPGVLGDSTFKLWKKRTISIE